MVQIELAESEWRPERLPLEWDLVTRSPESAAFPGRTHIGEQQLEFSRRLSRSLEMQPGGVG